MSGLSAAVETALRDEQARGWHRWGQATSQPIVERAAVLVDAVTAADAYADDDPDELAAYITRRAVVERVAAIRRRRPAADPGPDPDGAL